MSLDKTITVVPSYPAPSFADLADVAEELAVLADELQVDIVDNEFVPAISWPFTVSEVEPGEELGRLMELPSSLRLEMDCMVMDPTQYLDTFVEIGIGRVIIHFGSTDYYEECLTHAANNDYRIGLAILPNVVVSELLPLIERFNFVQIMGIAEVGKQGQPFDERALSVIKTIREAFPNMEIAVDGGVNEATIPALVAAGATRLAPGSAIVKASDRVSALQALTALANS